MDGARLTPAGLVGNGVHLLVTGPFLGQVVLDGLQILLQGLSAVGEEFGVVDAVVLLVEGPQGLPGQVGDVAGQSAGLVAISIAVQNPKQKNNSFERRPQT